ncbi:MAG: hypothetical protein ACRDV4_09685 [Acidimicrobiales bacterium]
MESYEAACPTRVHCSIRWRFAVEGHFASRASTTREAAVLRQLGFEAAVTSPMSVGWPAGWPAEWPRCPYR